MKTKNTLKKSIAQGNRSSYTESKELSEVSRCTRDIQLTMQIMPVPVENQIAVPPAVFQIRIWGHLDEDDS